MDKQHASLYMVPSFCNAKFLGVLIQACTVGELNGAGTHPSRSICLRLYSGDVQLRQWYCSRHEPYTYDLFISFFFF
jgi:hypothetical protein